MYKLKLKYPSEIDAQTLQHILKVYGSSAKGIKSISNSLGCHPSPSIELCRGLLALRDPQLGGRLAIEHVPALIGLMRFWKSAFRRCGPITSGSSAFNGRGMWNLKVSSYSLRGECNFTLKLNLDLETLIFKFVHFRLTVGRRCHC